MKLRHILILAACVLLFATCPVSADSVSEIPDLPAQLYGTLYNHKGEAFPAGTVLIAEVNGVTSTFTLTEAGKIGGSGTFDDKFLVSGATAGSEITFKIQGSDATVKQTYNPGSAMQIAQIQLTIPVEIQSQTTVNPQPAVTPTVSPVLPDTPGSEGEVIPTSTVPATPTATETAASPFPLAAVLFGLAGAGFCLRRR